MNIGQLRRTQLDSYLINVPYIQEFQETDVDMFSSNITFLNQSLKVQGENIFSNQLSHYLRFSVKSRIDSVQDFYIKLRNSNSVEVETQTIKNFEVKQGLDGWTTFELVISPNAIYNQLIFELRRSALDYTLINPDGSSGRKMDVKIEEFGITINVVEYLKEIYKDLDYIKRIGVQAPSGFLMVINGEEIRVGRSGIYEIEPNIISIKDIGFIVKESAFTQDGKEYFILDFQY